MNSVNETDYVYIHDMNIALYVHKELTIYQLESQYDWWRFVPNSSKNRIWLEKLKNVNNQWW
jgi:hypothetical protein